MKCFRLQNSVNENRDVGGEKNVRMDDDKLAVSGSIEEIQNDFTRGKNKITSHVIQVNSLFS